MRLHVTCARTFAYPQGEFNPTRTARSAFRETRIGMMWSFDDGFGFLQPLRIGRLRNEVEAIIRCGKVKLTDRETDCAFRFGIFRVDFVPEMLAKLLQIPTGICGFKRTS